MTDLYRLPPLAFDSDLVATLFEIERLRADIGTGTTPRDTYAELHRLFDTVMSVVSARIEGNHTTVYEAIDLVDGIEDPLTEQLREIANITEVARHLDELDPAEPLTHGLIRDLHARTVQGLSREGDPTPGAYRNQDVAITGSAHRPPPWVTVHAEMSSLLEFANAERPLHEQMMQIALSHHRFVWIHPFRNGNGRVSRLFTYAMLRRTIFATRGFSALNPTAVFGNDRAAYIAALEAADALDDEGTIAWASFFAKGIREDITRLIRLQDREYVIDALVGPALARLARDGQITTSEHRALNEVLNRGTVKAGDLAEVLLGTASQRSRIIRDLLDRQLLQHSVEGPRFYRLALSRGPLAPRLIRQLDALGYLPKMLSDD
ncbi:Fic family protein [Microbacterium sp. CIAB417]|uniref:Fic family protein n=1 Tax=Microbacterium sp. CIAB417 TaxID=2860287 RepID=UPI001FAD88D9|nr:Fic family protein [Microbacterium sp. CIAB417]